MGPSHIERLEHAASVYRLALARPDLERLCRYAAAILEQNQALNLTAVRTLDEALEVLVIPSLAVGQAWDRADAPRLAVDIGSGNGFPGVAIASIWPACRVLLVERRRKKARAVQKELATQRFANAEAVACDVRELARERPETVAAVDLATARGVGSLAAVVRLGAPLLARGGRLVVWKAADLPQEESREGLRVARARGLRQRPSVYEGAEAPWPGRLVVYERVEPTQGDA